MQEKFHKLNENAGKLLKKQRTFEKLFDECCEKEQVFRKNR